MDKIEQLMLKCGLSAEAATSICEAIQTHTASIREQLEAEYIKRTETAKRICVEETEQHKVELARRMQIFCEANSARIEQLVARQAQAREGQAVGVLETVKSLLSGISISDDSGLKAELVTMKEETDKLRRERDLAVTKANRQTTLAERVLRRNRLLEGKLATAEHTGHTVLGEGAARRSGQATGQRPVQRLDQNRRTGTPTTTRRTLTENQDHRDVVDTRTGNVRHNTMNNAALTPAQIAATIPDGPPV